ncbi:MAG: helix-turn-helix domain-containing protein [Bacteroidota bacterium]|jgi:transcriptional regulator with XRE-family HTH domain
MKTDTLRTTIKLLREQANRSQFSMAFALGHRKEDYYGRIERGEKELYVYELLVIAHALGISPTMLLYLSDYHVFTAPPLGPGISESPFNSQITPVMEEIKWKSYLSRKHCNENVFYMLLYAAIKYLRSQNRLNTLTLSRQLHFSDRHYAKMERTALPLSLAQCYSLCDCLNVSISKLMLTAYMYHWFTDYKGEFTNMTFCRQHFPVLFSK